MARDIDRIHSIVNALQEARLDALICTLPANVLLVSGYWPVNGASVAVITSEGYVSIIAPEDERDLAEQGWADELSLIKPASLSEIKPLAHSLRSRLAEAVYILERGARIGIEEASLEPSPYPSHYIYFDAISELLASVMPSCHLKPAGQLLSRLRATLTPRELQRVRAACNIAETAYAEGIITLRVERAETEVAAAFRAPLSTRGIGWDGALRADGFCFCMSGANSAKAYGLHQRSTGRDILPGEFAMVHCNSFADGFWTNITRTYCMGEPDDRQREIYDAILAARQAALATIRPGASAADVDAAAREVLEQRDLAEQFKHPLGHGVGFSTMNDHARPCLHPASKDLLELGMVFTVAPAIYFEGYGGVRHCDMVAVTATGAEVLTPFHSRMDELVLSCAEESTA